MQRNSRSAGYKRNINAYSLDHLPELANANESQNGSHMEVKSEQMNLKKIYKSQSYQNVR